MTTFTEKFVNNIRELAAIPGSLNAICSLITKSFDGLVKTPVTHLDNALETLTSEEHSLGILAILLAKYQQLEIVDTTTGKKFYTAEPADVNTLLTQTDTFVRTFNVEHVRTAVDSYNDMIHRMTELLTHRKEAMRGIAIAVKAIQRIRTDESQLTATHTDLCYLCLSAKSFEEAFQFLDVDITDIQKPSNLPSFDSKVFLLYYYYGGMIYSVFKKFKRASFFFEIVISTPGSVLSAIMVQAYKKYVLVNLICNSTDPLVPKFAAPIFVRNVKAHAAPYQELHQSYHSSVQATLQATVDKHKAVFEKDINYGLVKQCIKSLYIKNIKKLTKDEACIFMNIVRMNIIFSCLVPKLLKTFLTLSLTDVANRVHLPSSADAEKYLLKMIEDGEIYAKINKKDDMVEFHDNPEKYNNPQMLAHLQQQERICMAINKKMSEMEREISVTPDYVSKVGAYTGDDDGVKSSTSGALTSLTDHLQ